MLRYSLWLGVFLLLFIGRVTGQVLVAVAGVEWLPPMEHWYSGLLPYPILLPLQILIIALMFWIVRDFARGHGYFVRPNPRAGRIIRALSILYFASMVLRYVLTMWWHPELRWLTGTIPIWFHMVLASFLFTYSHYHLRRNP